MRTHLLRLLAVLFAFTVVAAACGSDDDEASSDDSAATTEAPAGDEAAGDEAADEEMTEEDIVAVAVASGEFPTLVAALQATGLDATLSGEGPFTVFAPTEEAFAAALTALDLTAEELLADTELLSSVLTYHVVADEVGSDVVVTLDGAAVETVNGATISVTVTEDGAVLINEEATVVQTDIGGSNGVIHVIDTVLLPPSE